MNNASCVDHLCSVNSVPNAGPVVPNLPVGAKLNHFWEVWAGIGAGPKVVQMLKDGYTLPFQTRPNLNRSPTIVSCYVHPHRNLYLLEALHQLTNKNAVELVRNQTSLGFYNRLFFHLSLVLHQLTKAPFEHIKEASVVRSYNRLFLVPKPNNKWRPILDLSFLNHFLKAEKFKMQTPETIRTSLQTREWVTSIDFKDAYFHILEISCPGQNLSIQSPTL